MMKNYQQLKKGAERLKRIGAELLDLNSAFCKVTLNQKKSKTLLPSQPQMSENQPHDHDHADDQMSAPIFNGQSSSTSVSFICGLCVEPIQLEDSFDFKGCTHLYCTPCIVKFVESKLQDNANWTLQCPVPTCSGKLDPDYCRPILPSHIFDSWMNALCDQIEKSSDRVESSNSSTIFTCEFCYGEKHLSDSFNVNGCPHFYCQQCIVNFVVSKLENNVTYIVCPEPGCRGVLDLQYCQPILPKDVFDWWGKVLCENVILGPESTDKYFYCPFKNCSALLVLEDEYVMDKSQCPHCKREVCLKCKVPWHTEFDCDKFQKLRNNGEDEMVMQLAKKKKWRKCPNCNSYVEKKMGALTSNAGVDMVSVTTVE